MGKNEAQSPKIVQILLIKKCVINKLNFKIIFCMKLPVFN